MTQIEGPTLDVAETSSLLGICRWLVQRAVHNGSLSGVRGVVGIAGWEQVRQVFDGGGKSPDATGKTVCWFWTRLGKSSGKSAWSSSCE